MKTYYTLLLLLILVFTSTLGSNIKHETSISPNRTKELNHHFSINKELHNTETNPMALHSITYANGSKKLMRYNAQDLLLSFQSYDVEDEVIFLNDIETCTYNDEGQLISQEVSKYDSWEEKIIAQWKYVYAYDVHSRMTSEIEYLLSDEAPYPLEYNKKEDYVYNEDGTFEIIIYNWDGKWEFDHKEIVFAKWKITEEKEDSKTYELEQIDSIHFYISDNSENNEWLLIGKQRMTHNENYQITMLYSIIFNEDKSIDSEMKIETTYNTNGDILSKTTEKYDLNNLEWYIITQKVYEYNGYNQIVMLENRSLNWSTGNLVPSIKETYEYNSQKQLKEKKLYFYEFANEASFTLSDKFEFSYKTINTENIMLASKSVGYYYNADDFYDEEFYQYGAIDEVKHYKLNYASESLELQKTGKYNYSEYTGTTNAINVPQISTMRVYPNPVIDAIAIESKTIKNGQLNIFSLSGQLVASTVIYNNSASVSLSHLPKGIYMLIANNNKGLTSSGKIIKQ